MNTVISVEGLSKTYGSKTVVESLNFKLEKGRVLGLLGANGQEKGLTMILVSHFMDEIEALCNETIILKKGKTIFESIFGTSILTGDTLLLFI